MICCFLVFLLIAGIAFSILRLGITLAKIEEEELKISLAEMEKERLRISSDKAFSLKDKHNE